jgi:14-3-3 protein epsilon
VGSRREAQVSMIKGYREKIEQELATICEDILEILD